MSLWPIVVVKLGQVRHVDHQHTVLPASTPAVLAGGRSLEEEGRNGAERQPRQDWIGVIANRTKDHGPIRLPKVESQTDDNLRWIVVAPALRC